jgi:hypothetical protein
MGSEPFRQGTMSKPRAYTVEEMRAMFLDHIRSIKNYWLNESRTPDVEDKMDGLIHSILVTFDGCSGAMPAFDIIPAPHPDDAAYHQGLGENWWAKEVINDCQLHDEWHAAKRKQNSHPRAKAMWKLHQEGKLTPIQLQLLKTWEKGEISQHEFERLALEML